MAVALERPSARPSSAQLDPRRRPDRARLWRRLVLHDRDLAPGLNRRLGLG